MSKVKLLSGLLMVVAITSGVMVGRFYKQDHIDVPAQTSQSSTLIDFQLPDVEGKPRALSEWRGKLLVVNFWATWCPPCLEEIPEFNRIQSEYAAAGVQFVGVAVDELAAVQAYLAKNSGNYPHLIAGDEGVLLSGKLGNENGVLPYTVIVSSQGEVLRMHAGALSGDELLSMLLPFLSAN